MRALRFAQYALVGHALRAAALKRHAVRALRFTQHEIDDPAPADVRPRPAAVIEDAVVVAARVLERVREDHDLFLGLLQRTNRNCVLPSGSRDRSRSP